jgi:GNAT superfamily N-acetyltransferase
MGRAFSFRVATAKDVGAIVALQTAVAGHLTGVHGKGPWSGAASEKGVWWAMRRSRVFVARQGAEVVATLRLTTTKPWAIDRRYFSKCERPLYLLGMAVQPGKQRRGLGRRCLEEAKRLARKWPADAICLDAFDAEAGAGGFYARCGYAEVGRATYRNVPLIYYELLLGSGQKSPIKRRHARGRGGTAIE